jgi:hypothetical protein
MSMPLPLPQIGSTNVRGYILPDTCGGDVEALESIYGNQKAIGFNPLVFFCFPHLDRSVLPTGTEILFDVVADQNGNPIGTNVRRA